MGEAKICKSEGFVVTTKRGHSLSQKVSEMLKSCSSASRFIIACAVLIVAVCFGACSTKSQLVGRWSDGGGMLFDPSNPWAEKWEFRSNDTCNMSKGMNSGQCKYTVLDNGTIKIEFQGGGTVTGKLENKNLIINRREEQTVLHKW